VPGLFHNTGISEQGLGRGEPDGDLGVVPCSLAMVRFSGDQTARGVYRSVPLPQRTDNPAPSSQFRLFAGCQLELICDRRRLFQTLRLEATLSSNCSSAVGAPPLCDLVMPPRRDRQGDKPNGEFLSLPGPCYSLPCPETLRPCRAHNPFYLLRDALNRKNKIDTTT